MLDIDMEFRKGILFVRLSGEFSVSNCSKLNDKLKKLVNENNVRFITFNVFGLSYIDLEGINTILRYNQALSKINGKALICGIENDFVKSRMYKSNILSSIFETKDELGAINYINLGGYI
ncbi:MAG: STAS domain-containing protein [Bacilli bacterium]|mgnify:CR=1 FL=1|nr:STAS domain-containing protein [Bacilli bacterium]MDD3305035.1 STAS domain-containing protein [Bacilli bacterium]MDD4053634.1 STAS domain-containing protein [Bacilli bacterium]MDD4411133.1 STAS domain-containing protein [Bacilli bacterium]